MTNSLKISIRNKTICFQICPSSSHSFGGSIAFKISIVSFLVSEDGAVADILQAVPPTLLELGSFGLKKI